MTIGAKWSDKEELELLNEINNNKTIKQIAEIHERTIGGINSRIRHIAYNMYKNNIPMSEIENKTRLTRKEIEYLIDRRIKHSSVKKNDYNGEIYERLIVIDKMIKEIKEIIC
jgi:hypothetical protein